MFDQGDNATLPPIPSKRYFTIGEVSELCMVKPHVLRYWEQEFSQLNPVKRRGNRRYYQRHDVEMICQIRHLLHEQGFTIEGARQQLMHQEAESTTLVVTKQQIAALRAQVQSALHCLQKKEPE